MNERMKDLQAPGKVSTVFLIDDDPSARRGLARLIQAAGHAVATFGSAREFLASGQTRRSPAAWCSTSACQN